MNVYWRAATAKQQFWANGASYLKSVTAVSQVQCSNTKSKCYVFFSQKLAYIGYLYHKVSPLNSKGKLTEHKEWAYYNKRSLKVRAKMNAIITVVLSPMHRQAFAWLKIKITSQSAMQQWGGVSCWPQRIVCGQKQWRRIDTKMLHQG